MSRIVLAIVASLLFLPVQSQAFPLPMFVVFNVTGDATDPLNAGQTSTGWFSFNVKPPETDKPIFYPETLIAFHWAGEDWDQTGAYVVDLFFGQNGDGILHGWDLSSGDPISGNEGASFDLKAGSVNPDDPAAGWVALRYTNETGSYRSDGSWYWTSTQPGPILASEPGALALIGFVGLAAYRRRR